MVENFLKSKNSRHFDLVEGVHLIKRIFHTFIYVSVYCDQSYLYIYIYIYIYKYISAAAFINYCQHLQFMYSA